MPPGKGLRGDSLPFRSLKGFLAVGLLVQETGRSLLPGLMCKQTLRHGPPLPNEVGPYFRKGTWAR